MKIAVAGIGYVGLSLAVLLSQNNDVVAVDIVKEKVDLINNKKSPIKDKEIESFLETKNLNLKATTDINVAYKNADFVIVATPTNYDETKNYFDTSSVESVIQQVVSINDKATIVIKSTIPIGFTKGIIEKYSYKNIIFSPEFLREGQALHDNLYPSRIIVGIDSKNTYLIEKSNDFINLLKQAAVKKDINVITMNSTEAESVKLFANTYLALRVSFFNELDSYAISNNLDSKQIIDGICADDRIGSFYNNPSFGYGGYCLPKDTKQLLANYKNIPQNIISAIVDSNDTRKQFIVDDIIQRKPKMVGIYRLVMKSASDNFRQSAIQDIMKKLKQNNVNIVVFEPMMKEKELFECKVVEDLNEFKSVSDIIVANRFCEELNDVKDKVYTRDVFCRD